MNRVLTIFQGNSLLVERFDHPEHCAHSDGESERTEYVAVTFVERGRFDLMQGQDWWSFSPRDVLVSTPGLKRRYRHFHERPDDVCLSVSFAPELIEDALGRLPRQPLPPQLIPSPASAFAFRWITRALDSSDPFAIETAAFHCAMALGPYSWERVARLSGAGTHAPLVRAACTAMATRLEENHSLTSIAREAGMSPFHFARVFSELAGESPHQYLVRARLRRAAKMLRRGASVTEAALKSGFPNLSHFSRTFRRRYGVPPARYHS